MESIGKENGNKCELKSVLNMVDEQNLLMGMSQSIVASLRVHHEDIHESPSLGTADVHTLLCVVERNLEAMDKLTQDIWEAHKVSQKVAA